MAYSQLSDIKLQLEDAALLELTDDANAGEIDPDVVARAIADADADIDTYLAVRYALPLSSTPAMVRKASVELAICNLYARRPGLLPEERKGRCERMREFLEQVAAGKRSLGADDPGASANDGPAATTDKDDRVFTIGKVSDDTSGTLDDY